MSPEAFASHWRKESLPLIAILRGIKPDEAVEVTEILLSAGFRYLEVPLNSLSPLQSISLMRESVGDRGYVGAGTVLNPGEVDQVAACGGQLIVSPNCCPEVIGRTRQLGLISLPGVMTPSEAFNALAAGASGLKFFPAESLSPAVLKAFRAVMPKDIVFLPVGGIQPDASQMRRYLQAGAQGFGLGSGLYQAGMSMADLRTRAQIWVQAWQQCEQ